jgi:hypothetical protein
VTVLQAGAAPRQVLHYQLTRGAITASELTYDFDVRADDTRDAAGTPTLVLTLETTVEDVLADGSAALRIKVVGARLRDRPSGQAAEPSDGRVADQPDNQVGSDLVRAQAAAAQGVVIHERVAPDGRISDARIEPAVPLAGSAQTRVDSLVQSLQQVAMRLPTDPVGVGATWTERKPLPEGGIRAMSETTYTLTGLTGTTIRYTGAGQATGATQVIEQDGMTVEVKDPRGHSETQGSIDLAHYGLDVTTSSSFAAAMAVDAGKNAPGAPSSTVEITVKLQIASLPASPGAATASTSAQTAAAPTAASAAPTTAAAPIETPAAPDSEPHRVN